MSQTKTQIKKEPKTVSMVLPALVLGLGIVALSIGVPKELQVRRLTSSGIRAPGRVIAIEHRGGKEIQNLAYNVDGVDFSVVYEKADGGAAAPVPVVVYLADQPKSATADLPGDAKLAAKYLLAGVLELGVGGWVLFASFRNRRRALAKTLGSNRRG